MSTKLTKWLKSCSSFLGLPNKIRGILTANFLTRFHCSVPSGFFLLPFYQKKSKNKKQTKNCYHSLFTRNPNSASPTVGLYPTAGVTISVHSENCFKPMSQYYFKI